jgi:predicted GNAT family acetyltransferase
MTSILDRPIWSALSTRHAELAEGGARARRYGQGVSLFASAKDDDPESLQALSDLAGPGDTMLLAQTGTVQLPPSLQMLSSAHVMQMILEHPIAGVADDRIVALGWADAEEMLALAALAKPGPFTLKSQALGDFWGIRDGGRLVAMAGERMKQPGYTEVSGICVHPDFQGRGLGRLLSCFVAQHILAGGETPYLHTRAVNAAAISLYESIGFRHRADLVFATIALSE